jgi:hypothetical protein
VCCVIYSRITVHSDSSYRNAVSKVHTAHVGGIKHVTFGGDGSQPPEFRHFLSTFLFAMLQLHELALLLFAVSGSASAAIGPGANLPIVNANIAPDGFPRP